MGKPCLIHLLTRQFDLKVVERLPFFDERLEGKSVSRIIQRDMMDIGPSHCLLQDPKPILLSVIEVIEDGRLFLWQSVLHYLQIALYLPVSIHVWDSSSNVNRLW